MAQFRGPIPGRTSGFKRAPSGPAAPVPRVVPAESSTQPGETTAAGTWGPLLGRWTSPELFSSHRNCSGVVSGRTGCFDCSSL